MTQIKRRSLLASAVAAVCSLFTGRRKATADEGEINSNDLFFIVEGAVFPGNGNVVIRPVTGVAEHDRDVKNEPNQMIFEKAPDYPSFVNPDAMYPRCNRFKLLTIARIGTIDELVNEYRKNLVAAAKRYSESPVTGPLTWDAQQEYLREARDGLRQRQPAAPGEPHFVPWDFDPILGEARICRDAEARRAELDALDAKGVAEWKANHAAD